MTIGSILLSLTGRHVCGPSIICLGAPAKQIIEVDYYSLGGKVHFVQLLSLPSLDTQLTLQGMPKETIGTLHAD
jgi:hypothetical protein